MRARIEHTERLGEPATLAKSRCARQNVVRRVSGGRGKPRPYRFGGIGRGVACGARQNVVARVLPGSAAAITPTVSTDVGGRIAASSITVAMSRVYLVHDVYEVLDIARRLAHSDVPMVHRDGSATLLTAAPAMNIRAASA